MLAQVRKAIRFPEAAKRKVAATIVRPFTNGSFPEESHIDMEWDTLIILDACRYDTFDKYNIFDTSATCVKSNASHTAEFIDRTFTEDHHDTVYITASPQVVGYESRFHDVIHVWDSDWDDELRTVRPDSVSATARKAVDEYPEKKLIIHYMQPHYPFIGPTGRELDTHATFTGGLQEREHLSVWELLSAGKVSIEDVRNAYEENLEIVLEDVTELVNELTGKTVITSDHGNLFGERVSPLPIRLYGHPPNIPSEKLIRVPLVELPFNSRRKTTISQPSETKTGQDNVESRLQDLGYL
jgi:hypothetical protein